MNCRAQLAEAQKQLDTDAAIIADLNKSVSSLSTELGMVKFAVDEQTRKIMQLEADLKACQDARPGPGVASSSRIVAGRV